MLNKKGQTSNDVVFTGADLLIQARDQHRRISHYLAWQSHILQQRANLLSSFVVTANTKKLGYDAENGNFCASVRVLLCVENP